MVDVLSGAAGDVTSERGSRGLKTGRLKGLVGLHRREVSQAPKRERSELKVAKRKEPETVNAV